jgi:hypothetical protein
MVAQQVLGSDALAFDLPFAVLSVSAQVLK